MTLISSLGAYVSRLFTNANINNKVINAFIDLYYRAGMGGSTYKTTTWAKVECQKCPTDLVVYQQILFSTKPSLVIECGTAKGGSTLFIAHMMDINNNGKIISIDIQDVQRPSHPRITYLTGSSTDPNVIKHVKDECLKHQTVMVILDSDHRQAHVTNELELYHPFVTKGQYLIVEDTIINGHPTLKEYGPGPHEALQSFLRGHREFEVDKSREPHLLTFNRGGYLKKIK